MWCPCAATFVEPEHKLRAVLRLRFVQLRSTDVAMLRSGSQLEKSAYDQRFVLLVCKSMCMCLSHIKIS